MPTAATGFDCYCECREQCYNQFKQDSTRYAYFFVALFFGLWYGESGPPSPGRCDSLPRRPGRR